MNLCSWLEVIVNISWKDNWVSHYAKKEDMQMKWL